MNLVKKLVKKMVRSEVFFRAVHDAVEDVLESRETESSPRDTLMEQVESLLPMLIQSLQRDLRPMPPDLRGPSPSDFVGFRPVTINDPTSLEEDEAFLAYAVAQQAQRLSDLQHQLKDLQAKRGREDATDPTHDARGKPLDPSVGK